MNPRKVGIIGCGNVGASIAFSLMPRRLFSHMVLLDIDQACAEEEAMDLSHGSPYAAAMTIETGSYPSLADCSLAIITTGAMQKFERLSRQPSPWLRHRVGHIAPEAAHVSAAQLRNAIAHIANP